MLLAELLYEIELTACSVETGLEQSDRKKANDEQCCPQFVPAAVQQL